MKPKIVCDDYIFFSYIFAEPSFIKTANPEMK